ncbi:hypothetical protein [Roseateles asaccharophilus]|uniref:TonB C-terminal domain-containing protein n=1 Tax=Roseateles asaccharophilus TaxID=582607 RepID=A0ABU2A979_9BURK|nr:hypothetical protein [Roseateles asaccharophilus]MDR7333560.1 hypothetical protein [Roseateles asaccharophilus]
MHHRTLLIAAALLALPAALQAAEAYSVTVAFDAQFDAQGRIAQLQPHEEAMAPSGFWSAVKQRVVPLRISPPRDASNQPGRLSTGLYVTLQVTPDAQGGRLQITGMDVRPLVLKRAYAAYPEELVKSAGWVGAVDAQCLVGADGRCSEVRVRALPGMPPSLLRWASDTMALWEFKPPRIDDRPLAATVRESFDLATPDIAPVNFLQRGSGNANFRW